MEAHLSSNVSAIHALWTFPAIIIAALVIAWAAECGQFYISQGLALAVLAWVQTLPEFAIEAVIALEAAKDPAKMHLVTANFTGSLRLFCGLGWPMVYFVSAFCGRKGCKLGESMYRPIRMDDEHSVAVISLLPALAYFLVIYFKATLTLFDAAVLAAIYFGYLWILSKMPPQDAEGVEDLHGIPRAIMKAGPPKSYFWIAGLFVFGAAALWYCAHPFLDSMLAVAVSLGMSQFVFVQWVAPFLSEFPEKLSAFQWARKVSKAPMALVNFVSSSINQWTILVATVPVIYSFGVGHPSHIVFDEHQRVEILLTIIQSYLGFLFLASMDFRMREAAGLFFLWLVQFIFPQVREEIIWIYGAWAAFETVKMALTWKERNAFHAFAALSRKHVTRSA